MIKIREIYTEQDSSRIRLCARIERNDRQECLWFETDKNYAEYLSIHCADAFVVLLVPYALETGEEIVCEYPVTERLHYQIEQYLIPALCPPANRGKVHIQAPLYTGHIETSHAVGTVFWGQTEAVKNSEYPLSHLLVWRSDNTEVPGLKTVFLNTNIDEVLGRPVSGGLFMRTLAGVHALQKLFGVFVMPCLQETKEWFPQFQEVMGCNLLLADCMTIDSLTFYLSGMGQKQNREKTTGIRIGRSYIEKRGRMSRLCTPVELDSHKSILWFETEEKYEQYFVTDRADAQVAGLLTMAMERGQDIISELPVSRRLLYQLNDYLIPALATHIPKWKHIQIYADSIDDQLSCEGAVGTGWTGGVDCSYTLMKHYNILHRSRRLTHLLVTSNGAIQAADSSRTLEKMVEKAKAFGEKNGLAVMGVNSNLQSFEEVNYLAVGAFRLPAVAMIFQKLFGIFYVSSDYDFSQFAFNGDASGYYQILPLAYYQTDCTVFYSSGGPVPRMQKLKELADFPLVHDTLHPCIYATRTHNCGRCGKCVRTVLGLYALGKLERFKGVFDTQDFYQNKEWYIRYAVAHKEMPHFREVLHYMKTYHIDEELIKRQEAMIRAVGKAIKRQSDKGMVGKENG